MGRVVVLLCLSVARLNLEFSNKSFSIFVEERRTRKNKAGNVLKFRTREFEKEGRYSKLDFNFRVRDAEEKKGVAMREF